MPAQPEQAQAVTVLGGDKEEESGKAVAKPSRVYGTPVPFPSRLQVEKTVKEKDTKAAVQDPVLPKLRDPGSFTLNIALGDGKEVSGMLDLGAGVNLMPYSMFKQLGIGIMKPTKIKLQLADKTVRYSLGIVEDVLVKVNGLSVLADFVIVDIGKVREGNGHALLLRRPFMATTNALIDMKNKTIKMKVLGRTVSLYADIDNAKQSGACAINYFSVNAIDLPIENDPLQVRSGKKKKKNLRAKKGFKKQRRAKKKKQPCQLNRVLSTGSEHDVPPTPSE